MPELLTLLPVVILAIGALVLGMLAPRLPVHMRRWIAPIVWGLELVALVVNMAPFTHRLVISTWQLASFSLVLEMDGITSLLLLTLFVTLAALWLVESPRDSYDALAAGILTAAVLFTLAGNMATLYFAWVLLDLAIFTWRLTRNVERENALRSLALSALIALGFFAGSPFTGTPYGAAATALLSVALWARLGLFPFHWLYPVRGTEARELWIARGVPLLTTASLVIRWTRLEAGVPDRSIAILAALALAVAPNWIWREEQPSRIVVPGVWHLVALIPLAILYGTGAGMAFAFWLTLSAGMALAFFELALRWRAENRNRWARILWILGMLSITGIPLTPAFLARVGVYVSLWESGEWWLLPIAAVATTLVLAPFWNFGLVLEGTDARDPRRHEYAGLVVVLIAFAILSLGPLLIAPAMGPEMAASADAAILRVIRTNDAVGVAIGFAVLVLPLVVAFPLRRLAGQFRPHPRSLIPRTARALDLDWLEPVVTGIGYEMGATARNLSTLAEENPTVWILLVALWVAIFVMIPR